VEVVFAHVVKLSIVARSGISVSAGNRSEVVGPKSNMDSSHCRLTMRTRNPRLLTMPRFLRLVVLLETGTERPAVRMGSTPFKGGRAWVPTTRLTEIAVLLAQATLNGKRRATSGQTREVRTRADSSLTQCLDSSKQVTVHSRMTVFHGGRQVRSDMVGLSSHGKSHKVSAAFVSKPIKRTPRKWV
jgi:hypothetical protein